MRIGCLFGTFDPPHSGHVAIATWMLEHAGLDEVWLVVTPQNPMKLGHAMSPDNDRLAMARLAIKDLPRIRVSDVEWQLPRPHYTVDSLAFMRAYWPEHEFALIIGSDNLRTFDQWKGPEEILAHHRVLVYPRPGSDRDPAPEIFLGHPNLVLTEAPRMGISSTDIRKALHGHKAFGNLLPQGVLDYVMARGLYSS